MIPDSKTITHKDREAIISKMPEPPRFFSDDEIEAITEDQACEVMRYVRRTLLDHLLFQEFHEHMLDDCGDYLEAATHNWTTLHNDYFTNDGEDFVSYVKAFLLASYDDAKYPWGGCDGEARWELLGEELAESRNIDPHGTPIER